MTFLRLLPHHLLLLALLLSASCAMILYAILCHRLLNRKIFISRKIVYSFTIPALLASYLMGLGLVTIVMRWFGVELSFLLKWMLICLGMVGVGMVLLSREMRRKIQYFISTHFYVNKYEYRDEWLAFSRYLQDATTEQDVIMALEAILEDSLYTKRICIWSGSEDSGLNLAISSIRDFAGQGAEFPGLSIPPGHPLIRQIRPQNSETEPPYIIITSKDQDLMVHGAVRPDEKTENLMKELGLVLLYPITLGGSLLGMIGLGAEYTGGSYGQDDLDLLKALSTQTASAILVARASLKLVETRQRLAWERLSAFVLHDIKNAASMLSLLRENAHDHLDDPEFQKDMLEAVDDALRRMRRVENRLKPLKGDIEPVMKNIDLEQFLREVIHCMEKKLSRMKIVTKFGEKITITSDEALLSSILENILLNALEAGGTMVDIRVTRDDDTGEALIEVTDNGPGIDEDLLPHVLFEPFRSSKEGGSGIGLWQVKKFVTSIGGSISAENRPGNGARFVIRLPLA